MDRTRKLRRELGYGLAKLRGLEESVDASNDDSSARALAIQTREQAEICLHLLDQYQSSVPSRMWSDAERRCHPLREDLRRIGVRLRTVSGEWELRSEERQWERSWWSSTDQSLACEPITGTRHGDDTGLVLVDPESVKVEAVAVPIRPIDIELIDLAFDPDPQAVAADPTEMMTLVTILVGPPPDGGGEIFCATFCTPEWLAAQCQSESFVPVAGVLMVRSEDFAEILVRREIERFLSQIREQTWGEVAERIKEWFPYWEIDGYAPITLDGHADSASG
jgi:hypothetical protein